MEQDLSGSSAPQTPGNVHMAPSHSFSRRGPWKWTDYLGFYLPSYDGPHDVGTLTLELPIPEPYANYELSSPMKNIDSNNLPILELNNPLLTIFYPTKRTSSGSCGSIFNFSAFQSNKQSRLGWITLAQIKGYLRFATVTSWKRWLIIPPVFLALGTTKLPTRGGAPILKKSTDSQQPSHPEANEKNTDDKKRYKLIIFSHGLTGNRTCYSQLCGTLASQGYVVAALEHRDGTGSHSLCNSRVEDKIVSKEVPYVDMGDVTAETRPDNYLIARAFQLELRTIELLAGAKLLSDFARSSDGWKSIRDANLRVRRSAGWAGDDGLNWNDQQWSDFANAVQWNRDVTIAGHSFGAATVIAAARHENRPPAWCRFILYDPWIETLNHMSEKFMKELTTGLGSDTFPCLILNSPGFTDWKDHFKQLQDLFIVSINEHDRNEKNNNKDSVCCLMATLGGIIHSSFSDLPVLAEWVWKLTKKLKLDSQKAIKIITSLTIEFLEFPINPILRSDSIDNEENKNENSKLNTTNPLESFVHHHNLGLENPKIQHQQEHDDFDRFSDFLQPGKLYVHFKRFLN